jgi:LPS-assembly protein
LPHVISIGTGESSVAPLEYRTPAPVMVDASYCRHRRRTALSARLFGSAVCLIVITASAADRAVECPVDRPTAPQMPRPAVAPAAPGPMQARANQARALENDVTELEGNATLRRDGAQLNADYLRYDRATDQAQARGNVTLTQPGAGQFRTDDARVNLDTGAGFTGAGTFDLPQAQGRGDMGRADLLDHDHTRLTDVRYTTCPAGRDDWFLRAATLDIDTAENIGVARNVSVDFLGVPIFYLPYLSFPISDERKSGFLMPQVGVGSTRGTMIAAPYYLNLSPNYDATLTPRLMSKRGVQLQSEFRYLGHASNSFLDLEYLPHDKQTGDDRAAGVFHHRHSFTPHWSALVDLRRVSDADYLSDFGDHLQVTGQTHLPQSAEVNYRGSSWNFTARAADYQTVDRTIAPADQPYARLPQLLLTGRSPNRTGELHYRLDSELVHFSRDIGVTGERAHVRPAASLPLARSYGFITPELGVHHIAYSLDSNPDARPGVSVPYAALDSGLVFERDLALGATNFIQTLEPRLYYLYVPFRTQDNLPNFDTSVPDFTFDNLFRTNRFVGGDRVGDANQVTLALTTRFIDEASGAERLRASLGRIYYFDDRRVQLTPTVDGRASSDIAAEAVAWLAGNWYGRATVQWASAADHAARSSYYVQYNPAANKIVNVGRRYARGELDQADISFDWPLAGPWSARGRSLYSLRDSENVESYLGLQYNACCWSLRLYGARRLTQVAGGTDQRGQVTLELELTGFAKTGGAPESPLRQSVFGYAPGTGMIPTSP